jgi:hypothetical protein
LKKPERFNKALVYGSIGYFQRENIFTLIEVLFARFKNVSRLVVGNVPDLELLGGFYSEGRYVTGVENNPDSDLGIWWSRNQLQAIAEQLDLKIHFEIMPAPFYARNYRFDAVFYR